MKKSLKTSFCILTVIFLITAVLAGCTQMGRTPDMYNTGTGTRQGGVNQGYGTNNLAGLRNRNITGNTTGNMTNITGTNIGNNRPGYNRTNLGTNNVTNQGNVTGTVNNQLTAADRRRASNIKRQLLSMDGVDAVDVIVIGDTALVGVKTYGRNMTPANVKNSIARKVKEIDKTIKNVTVSDSPDILSRMRRLETSVTGQAKNIMDEFRELLNAAATGRK